MLRKMKILGNILIILLTIWSASVSIAFLLDTSIYFPWRQALAGEIPIYRLEAVRVAVLLTFTHFGVLHIFGKKCSALSY